MFAMVIGWGNYDGGIANLRFGQGFERRKNRDLAANAGAEALSAFHIEIRQCGKFAAMIAAGELMQMERVNLSHASKPGNGNFQGFRHTSNIVPNGSLQPPSLLSPGYKDLVGRCEAGVLFDHCDVHRL
jgi:hypothetical protein